MIEERLDQYENAGLRSRFEHLRAMAVKEKAEQGWASSSKPGSLSRSSTSCSMPTFTAMVVGGLRAHPTDFTSSSRRK